MSRDFKVTPTVNGDAVVVTTDSRLSDQRVPTSSYRVSTINFTVGSLDPGTPPLQTGIKGDTIVDFACTINQVTVLGDQVGSIIWDIWKDAYANYPPAVADSIVASAPPTLSGAQKSQDATLTGWSPSLSAGDILRWNIQLVSGLYMCTVSLKVTRT